MHIKVLNVITGCLSTDGITSIWLTYCREMRRLGLEKEVEIVVPYIEGRSLPSVEAKFNALGIETPHLPNRQKHPLKYFFALKRLIKQGKYDIVHANGSSSLMFIEMLAAALCVVAVRASHSHNTKCAQTWAHFVFRLPFRLLCNTRFACGEDAGKWLFPNQDFTVLNNGKDLSLFQFSQERRNEMRPKLGLDSNFVVGHVGKFNMTKNHRFLIEVFAELLKLEPNSKLCLVGIGQLMDETKNLVVEKGIDHAVIFTGQVDNIPDYLQAMDYMVLPSLFEGLPNVVLEWQAIGLPCLLSNVVTRQCAPTELVTFMELEKGSKDWASMIQSQMNKFTNRQENSIKAIESLRRAGFDISENVKFLVAKYKELLEKHQ